MSRKRTQREVESSLFPFLSVLACLIGTLTLLIAALALGQVAEDLLDAEVDPVQIEQLEAERAALRGLQAELADSDRVNEELTAAKAELRALGISPNQSEAKRRRAVTARQSAASLASLVRQLEQERKELSGSIQGVEVELVKDRPDDDSRPIRILPHGTARALRPFFVECRKDGVRVYREDFQGSYYLSRGSLDDAARFTAFLQRVRTVRDGTVIFLIRPDGVETYIWASGRTGRIYVRHAKLPLPTQGSLEFSL
jgi:hypothetical protein